MAAVDPLALAAALLDARGRGWPPEVVAALDAIAARAEHERRCASCRTDPDLPYLLGALRGGYDEQLADLAAAARELGEELGLVGPHCTR